MAVSETERFGLGKRLKGAGRESKKMRNGATVLEYHQGAFLERAKVIGYFEARSSRGIEMSTIWRDRGNFVFLC